jgi:hypothetical protein
MQADQWQAISRVLEYMMQQPTKPIKETPGSYTIKDEPEKSKRKVGRQKKPPMEQFTLF